MQGIYCIENLVSGRKYYGSSMNLKKRLLQHKRDLKNKIHHNIQLQRSFNKHGITSFNFYIVEETQFITKKELLLYEQTYLDKNIGGYNMAPANGGDTLSHHPNKNEIREKIIKSHQKILNLLTPEERKIKFGKLGDTNPNWKDGGVSYKLCPICNRNRIFHLSTTCGACRDRTGKNNSFFGKHHTEETKKYLREINKGDNSWIKGINPADLPYTKRYEISYPDGTTKEVAGLKSIATEFKVSIENVHATIKRMSDGKIPKRGVFAGIIIKAV